MWKSIDIMCDNKSCGCAWGEIVDKLDQDAEFRCPVCSGPSHRTILTINNLKSSYPDGHYRQDGIGRAAALDRLENQFHSAKERGDAGFAEETAKEYIQKKGEK